MDSKDTNIFLSHILESISYIEHDTDGKSKQDFLNDRVVQDLVVRRLAVIGEAARNIPDDFRKKHKQIPWRSITGMRDVVVHDYFSLDFGRIWDTVENDLPKVKKEIEKIIQ